MLALEIADQAQPCQVPFAVLGSGARASGRAQEPLLDVEVNGSGSHPRMMGKLPESETFDFHALIVSVIRCTVK